MNASLRLPADIGVLLADMGGPESVDDIESFLLGIMGDPRILRVPFGPLLRPLLARRISRTRAPRVAPRYQAIGGGSPLLRLNSAIARALEAHMDGPAGVTMRYTEPRMGPALADLRARGARRIVLIPLYPMSSTSTTSSTLDDLARSDSDGLEIAVVERHGGHPVFLDLMVRLLTEARGRAPAGAHVLFTAHSIPVSFTRAGDPYVSEIEASMDGISTRAGLSSKEFSLAWQSAASRGRWHGPTWEEALVRLHAEGVRDLVVHPLSFVSENLETLWDLDIEIRRHCDTLGLSLERVPTPGPAPEYPLLLSALASNAAVTEGWL